MKSLIVISTAALTLSLGSAMAESNRDAARSMASTLKGTPGIGSAATTLSGKNASAKGDSGWGNAGSRIVSGAQVSKRNK